MKNAFNLAKDIYSILSYKGLPFPGRWFSFPADKLPEGENFEYKGEPFELKTHSDLGTVLRKQDAQGRYYFLPVVLIHKKKEFEIPNAVISITGSKTIVETPMTGRRGTVKELISLNDYEINISGAVVGSDFPESELSELNELFNINESIEIKCALTDLFLEEDDKVIIKNMEFGEMRGTDTLQTVNMELVSDRSFELIIE